MGRGGRRVIGSGGEVDVLGGNGKGWKGKECLLQYVPEKQTCVFFYAATGQVACAINGSRFRSDAGVSTGTRSAVDSVAAAEVGRQEGWTGTAGVSQPTCQRIC